MCGFVGLVGDYQSIKDTLSLKKLSLRGPDDEKTYENDNIFLRFYRLKFVGDELANQPLTRNNNIILFNGEIYNWKELSDAYQISCSGDTDLLIQAHNTGKLKSILQNSEGMFAGVIINSLNYQITFFRDNFGMKPLYFISNNKYFGFSSLPDVFKQEINYQKLDRFLFYKGSKSESLFDNIKEINPGIHIFNKNDKTSLYENVAQDYLVYQPEKEFDLHQSLQKSINYCWTNKYNGGAMISGGIDSSIITCLSANRESYDKFKLYAVTTNIENKEFDKIRKRITKKYNLDLKTIHFTKDDFENYWANCLSDFPEVQPNMIAINKICKEANKDSIKFLLSGEGADELFFGYNKFFTLYSVLNSQKDLLNKISLFLKYLFYALYSMPQKLFILNKIFNFNFIKNSDFDQLFDNFYQTPIKNNDIFYDLRNILLKKLDINEILILMDEFRNYEINNNLRCLLQRVDRASMMNGLEVRLPFLNKLVFASILKRDFNLLTKNGEQSKFLLKKKAVQNNYLYKNEAFIQKDGFPLPVASYLLEIEKSNFFKNCIEWSREYTPNYFNSIKYKLESTSLPKPYVGNDLWPLYAAFKWSQKYTLFK